MTQKPAAAVGPDDRVVAYTYDGQTYWIDDCPVVTRVSRAAGEAACPDGAVVLCANDDGRAADQDQPDHVFILDPADQVTVS